MMIKITVVTLVMLTAATSSVLAQTPTPSPSLEQRVSDLEAYMNNSARGADRANATTPSNISGPGPGHNAWLMTSALLVLFMTLPGLALFYGGLVRQKNVLSILAQCLGIAGLVTILWWAIGYSLVFAHGCAFFGGTRFAFLRGVTAAPNTDYSYWVSHNVFAMYQLMFAIITPALIIGSVAERMKFSAVMLIVGLWMFLVYFPLAHMVWGIDGLMNGVWNPNARIRAIDFAGGTVVHMSSGWSALLLCLFLGPRLGFRKEIMAPHSMALCMVGTGMRWVGWYGFNAGSALGAVIIGVLAGAVPFFACTKLKSWFHYDDALDTFGVHAVGGTLGAFLTGLLATATVNSNLSATAASQNGLAKIVGHMLWLEQLKAIGITIALALIGTSLIGFLVRATLELRIAPEIERQGLDINLHGEEGYIVSG